MIGYNTHAFNECRIFLLKAVDLSACLLFKASFPKSYLNKAVKTLKRICSYYSLDSLFLQEGTCRETLH